MEGLETVLMYWRWWFTYFTLPHLLFPVLFHGCGAFISPTPCYPLASSHFVTVSPSCARLSETWQWIDGDMTAASGGADTVVRDERARSFDTECKSVKHEIFFYFSFEEAQWCEVNRIITIPHTGPKLNKLKNSDLIITSHFLNYFLPIQTVFHVGAGKIRAPPAFFDRPTYSYSNFI